MPAITKLLAQLALFAPAITQAVDKLRELIETLRKPGAGTQKQLDDLKQAIELQDTVNKKINDELRIIRSVLEHVQQSLKVLAYAALGIGLVALVALYFAVAK
jgi:predicted PurR-regulated permease PerM